MRTVKITLLLQVDDELEQEIANDQEVSLIDGEMAESYIARADDVAVFDVDLDA